MPYELNTEGRPTTGAQRRRYAKAEATLKAWMATFAPDTMPAMFRPWAIVEGTGTPIEQLAPALHHLGWQRVQYRESRAAPRIYWIPPGCPNPVRPVGRPPGLPKNRKMPGQRAVGHGTTHQGSTEAV